MGGVRDCRYKKTEEKILAVFFNEPKCPMWKLAKKAGVARSTVYTHHNSVHQITPDCEKDILEEYDTIIERKLDLKQVELKMLYLDMLVFIIKNRQVFALFFKFGNREVIIKMILKLKSKIKEPEKILRICASEMAEIIFEWGQRNFSEEEIEKILSDMMYLTVSARKRLGPLV